MRKLLLILLPFIALLFAFRFLEEYIVTGLVLDERGQAIPFATVAEKSTKNAVQCDAKGMFTIKVRNKNAVLTISSTGYTSQDVWLKGKQNIIVSMASAHQQLQEVVVTALGTRRKHEIMGYATPILMGKASGLQINGYNSNHNTEDYDNIAENGFHKAKEEPLSTFSIDVDVASYSNVRRFITEGSLPPAGAVRTEEMINYFRYDYPAPSGDHPFSINSEMASCPWNPKHKLVLIGMQGKKISFDALPASNLVFLIDVSGSMQNANKLPLVQSSLKLLVDQLRDEDKISIVVYAGAAGLVLPATSGKEKIKIKSAIDELEAGGSTAGGEGIRLAYNVAKEQFMPKGNNRVILCTDGDFNVGVSSDDDLIRLVEEKRSSGVYLTVLGYGMGNYKDNKMQKIADKGNGNHAYIDNINEARKVLVSEFGGTLFTIAKDAKLQVEFNPAKVAGYRLIGYENRMLQKEDFNDDKKDAGELGSGHTVTALYEVIPAGVKSTFLKDVDSLKYKQPKSNSSSNDEILTVKFRYKNPTDNNSQLLTAVVLESNKQTKTPSENFRFAASVAMYGMLLRNSEFKGTANFTDLIKMVKNAKEFDGEGYRKEFLELVKKTQLLSKSATEEEANSE